MLGWEGYLARGSKRKRARGIGRRRLRLGTSWESAKPRAPVAALGSDQTICSRVAHVAPAEQGRTPDSWIAGAVNRPTTATPRRNRGRSHLLECIQAL